METRVIKDWRLFTQTMRWQKNGLQIWKDEHPSLLSYFKLYSIDSSRI
jgi:hypothetical protein